MKGKELREIYDKKEQAERYNEGKLQWGLVDFESLSPMVRVLEYGANKYSANNWKGGLPRKELLESAMRHLAAMLDGEKNDKESGLPHEGHLMCNMMFYAYFCRMNKFVPKD